MNIYSVRLQNVRRHIDASFEFTQGVNVLVGPNACGKTTILEAISLAATGKTLNSKTKDMLTTGSDWMRIDLNADDQERIVKYEPQKSALRTIDLDGKTIARLNHAQVAPIVWFDPEQLRLLRGSPVRRREYMDYVLSQLDPNYSRHLSQYTRALRQRNALLKQARPTKDMVFVWNVRLAEHGEYIYQARRDFTDSLAGKLEATYKDLSGAAKSITPIYQSIGLKGKYSEALLRELEVGFARDKALGHTSSGPHRDDLLFSDDTGQALGLTASRGEVRTLVLALKLLEVEALSKVFVGDPVLLFDDVFSELDGSRRQAFTGALSHIQTIITTTDADIVTKDFAQHAKVIAI